MKPMQEKLLEMLKWFHSYCVENNIRYYAVGGTMIGAMRHSGFIPWDDDIDLALPREDYERLIHMFTGNVDGYVLESPYSGNKDYIYTYAKLYDTNTTLIEKTRIPCKRGIYIDVFPLDGVGDTIEEAKESVAKIDRKNMFLMTRTCMLRKDRSWYKNFSIIASRLIPPFIVNDKSLSIAVDKLAQDINRDDAKYVANTMGAYRFKEISLRENFGEPTLYPFENTNIYGPQKADEYLTGVYGDWRQLPPPEKRYTKHDYVELDLDKSYLE